MKKALLLFVSAFIFMSCSSDDNTPAPSLEKVIFYRNSADERQWNFNTDGLLSSITLHDGTIVEKFTYDSQKNVVLTEKYENGSISESYTITYNSDHSINTINNINCNYNAVSRLYSYNDGTTTVNCSVTPTGLVAGYYRINNVSTIAEKSYELHYNSAGTDVTSYEKKINGVTTVFRNFHYDTKINDNPIDEAILAVSKIKSILDPDFFIDNQASASIAIGFDQGAISPYYFNYGFTAADNYQQIGIEVLNNNTIVDYILFAEYYYKAL